MSPRIKEEAVLIFVILPGPIPWREGQSGEGDQISLNLALTPSISRAQKRGGFPFTFLSLHGAVDPCLRHLWKKYRKCQGEQEYGQDLPKISSKAIHPMGITQADLAPENIYAEGCWVLQPR